MIRVAIVEEGKFLSPKDLTSPADLQSAVAQARSLIVECEKLLRASSGTGHAPNQGGIPYLT
jgi:hypothetical protein